MKEVQTRLVVGKSNSRQKDLLRKRKMLFEMTDASEGGIQTTDAEFEDYFKPCNKNISLNNQERGLEEEPIATPPKSKKTCVDRTETCENIVLDDDTPSKVITSGDLFIYSFQLPNTSSEQQTGESNCESSSNNNDVIGISIDNKSTLIGINCLSTGIKIHGCGKLTALKGSFSVNGYEFNKGTTETVFAPMSHCAAVIKPTSIGSNDQLKKKWKKNKFDEVIKFGVVILVESDDSLLDCLPGYPNLFNVKQGDVEDASLICDGVWSCKTSWYFTEHQCYSEASKDIIQCALESKQHQTILTAGGKNAGKSSFNRYLVNKLLSITSPVYYLECDIGQTEFTPSGLLSIQKITAPLLGPPFTHQLTPVSSCYLGYASPSCDPDRYIMCLQYLVQHLRQYCNDGPLVINTMGWNRALGLQLLVDTIRYTTPTHIVQFETRRESRNIVPLTNEYLANGRGWMTQNDDGYDTLTQLKILSVDNTLPNVIKYKAPDLRHLAFLSCMSAMIRGHQLSSILENKGMLSALQSCRPFCVDLKHVRICNATENVVKSKHVLQAINASVVGLCVDKSISSCETVQDPEEYLPAPNVCPCLGIAIVRGVDVEKRAIYIISSLSFDAISKVNCIVLGSQSIPDTLLLQSTKPAPYKTTNFPYETVGAGRFRVHRKFSKIRDNNTTTTG